MNYLSLQLHKREDAQEKVCESFILDEPIVTLSHYSSQRQKLNECLTLSQSSCIATFVFDMLVLFFF